MFGSRVGYSGSADRMALFPVSSNPSWWQAAILDNFEWPYLRNGSFDPLYSAHRAVIFAIAQLSCFQITATLTSVASVPNLITKQPALTTVILCRPTAIFLSLK